MKIIGNLLRVLGYIKTSEAKDVKYTDPVNIPKESEEMIVINGVARPKKKFTNSTPKFIRKDK